jgi:carbohydrate-selective porin OprB
VPKPWFLDIANDKGEFGEGRVDADMYFWKMFRAAGNKVFVTPRVTLGHGEYMITWPGKSLNSPVYQHTTPFVNEGKKPDDAWRIGE